MKKSKVIDILSKNILFSGIDTERIDYLLSLCKYKIILFEKNNIISYEDSLCREIGFVLDGKVSAVKLNPNGTHMVVRSILEGDFFGDALVFSSVQKCPTNIITATKATILFIPYESLLYFCEVDELFLKNFLRSLSDKIFLLNEKIKILSYHSVRQRLCYYLIKQSKIQKTNEIVLNITREELGNLLGTARPSISRELSKMVEDGLISVDGRNVVILDFDDMNLLL